MTKLTICWTRLSKYLGIDWIKTFSDKALPMSLPLEGTGIQYICAFDNTELEVIAQKMKDNNHEFKIEKYEYDINHVKIRYGKEPKYFLYK